MGLSNEERKLIDEMGEMQLTLEAAAEDANARIAEVEEALSEIHFSSTNRVLDETDRIVRWGRLDDGNWALLTSTTDNGKLPLRKANLQRRVEACAHLTEVIRRVHRRMREVIGGADADDWKPEKMGPGVRWG